MILVTGSTGFVGSHLVRGLAQAGHRVRALARDPERASGIKGEGVETVIGDVGDIESLRRAVDGCDAVIHLVGIIQPGPGYTFQSVHVEGTRNVITAAKEARVGHFIYQSALGTREGARSEYHRTKLAAEGLTRASGLNYTITRPSIIYGEGDGFTTRMTGIIRRAPIVPVIGRGLGLLQPVYIADLVEAFLRILHNPAYMGKTLAIVGPERLSFNEVIARLEDALGVRRPLVHAPVWAVRPVVAVLERLMARPPVTNDQITMLEEDNAAPMDDMEALGIKPVAFKEGLKLLSLLVKRK